MIQMGTIPGGNSATTRPVDSLNGFIGREIRFSSDKYRGGFPRHAFPSLPLLSNELDDRLGSAWFMRNPPAPRETAFLTIVAISFSAT